MAINCHHQAAALYRELGMPEDWAREQFNQGNAWCDLPEEGHSEKWEQVLRFMKGRSKSEPEKRPRNCMRPRCKT